MFFDLSKPITLQFLNENIKKDSELCKYFLGIIEDDDKLAEVVDKFTKDIDNDISMQINKGTIIIREIANYNNMLEKIGLDKDCPKENIRIEGLPNINGQLLITMFLCSISGESGISEIITNRFLDIFNKQSLQELYDAYFRIFPEFMSALINESVERDQCFENLGDTFEKSLDVLSDVLKKKEQIMLAESFISSFSNVYSDTDKGYNDKCSICLEKFKEKEVVFRLPCKHNFHFDCAARYDSILTSCPNCRDEPISNVKIINNIEKTAEIFSETKNTGPYNTLKQTITECSDTLNKIRELR